MRIPRGPCGLQPRDRTRPDGRARLGLRGEGRYKLEHWEACIRDLDEAGRLDAKEKEEVREMLATARKRFAAGERLLEGCTSAIIALAASPDGRTVAAACADTKVRLWDPTIGRSLGTVDAGGDTHCLAFSPDGKILATGTRNQLVSLFGAPVLRIGQTWIGPIGESISGGPGRVKKAVEEYERGAKLAGKGDPAGAEKAFTAAIARNSRMARAYADRATDRLQQFRLDVAFDDYDIALRIDGWMPEARLRKGIVRAAQSEKSPKERDLLLEAESHVSGALAICGPDWTDKPKAEGALKEIRRRLEKLKK